MWLDKVKHAGYNGTKKKFKIKLKYLIFTGNKSLPKIYENWCPTEEILGRY